VTGLSSDLEYMAHQAECHGFLLNLFGATLKRAEGDPFVIALLPYF